MKNLILFLALFFSVCFSYGQNSRIAIGKIEDGKPVLKVQQGKIISNLSDNLASESRIKETFYKMEIYQRKENYFLSFKGDKYITNFLVTRSGDELFAESNVSCTSVATSFSYSCTPSVKAGECLCNSCGDADCIKTCSTKNLLSE